MSFFVVAGLLTLLLLPASGRRGDHLGWPCGLGVRGKLSVLLPAA